MSKQESRVKVTAGLPCAVVDHTWRFQARHGSRLRRHQAQTASDTIEGANRGRCTQTTKAGSRKQRRSHEPPAANRIDTQANQPAHQGRQAQAVGKRVKARVWKPKRWQAQMMCKHAVHTRGQSGRRSKFRQRRQPTSPHHSFFHTHTFYTTRIVFRLSALPN